ncbi:P-loop containing nucleoside triphosphate hydrolase protein, partial [Gorgonomyces haynaldii]
PTPTQELLIPSMLSHSDIILKDMTGTGKSMGLLMGVLSKKHPSVLARTPDQPLQMSVPHLKPEDRLMREYIKTLVIVPTRELAVQLTHWIKDMRYGSNPPPSTNHLVQSFVSGVPFEEQVKQLQQRTPQIVIGTPVRLLELYQDKIFDFTRLQMLVIDEVDRIVGSPTRYMSVSQRFNLIKHPPAGEVLVDKILKERKQHQKRQKTIQKDYKELNEQRSSKDQIQLDAAQLRRCQVIVASATVNHALRGLLKKKKWQQDPVLMDMSSTQKPPITHLAYICDQFEKLEPEVILSGSELEQHLQTPQQEYPPAIPDDDDKMIDSIQKIHNQGTCFVFANSSTSLTSLVDRMQQRGLKAEKLMNLIQYNTETGSKPFEKVYKGECDYIVATEYEARGLDLPQAKTVFILGLASSPGSYLHMSGRVGRFGNTGKSITLLGGKRYEKRFKDMMRLLRLQL